MKTKILYATLGVALAVVAGMFIHKNMEKKEHKGCGCGCQNKTNGVAPTTASQEMANATGRSNSKMFPGACLKCRTADGLTYVPSRGTNCDFADGERCLTK